MLGVAPAVIAMVPTARPVNAMEVRDSFDDCLFPLMRHPGLVCTDAGITAKAIYAEFGYGDQGQFGGERTSWDLSFVGGSVNLATRLKSSDGQTVTCASSSCATNQAFHGDQDFGAVRNSALGATYTQTFCP